MVARLSKQIDQLKAGQIRTMQSTKEGISVGTMTQQPLNTEREALSIDVSRLKADREFYQREYLKLKSLQFNESERRKTCRGTAAGYDGVHCTEIPMSLHHHHHHECPTNATNCHRSANRCDHEQQHVEQLKQRVRELESENKSLHATHGPNKAMCNALKEELMQLRLQIDELTAENSRLHTSYNQLK